MGPHDPFSSIAIFTVPPDESPQAIAECPTRGVGWVLRCAGAVATLFTSLVVLTETGYQFSAERTLARAARAGALEATLPRASYQTVRHCVARRLGGLLPAARDWQLTLQQNETPVRSMLMLRPADGDVLAVTIVASERAFLPTWLRKLHFWKSESKFEARAEQRMPSRQIRQVRTEP